MGVDKIGVEEMGSRRSGMTRCKQRPLFEQGIVHAFKTLKPSFIPISSLSVNFTVVSMF